MSAGEHGQQQFRLLLIIEVVNVHSEKILIQKGYEIRKKDHFVLSLQFPSGHTVVSCVKKDVI